MRACCALRQEKMEITILNSSIVVVVTAISAIHA